MRDECVGRFPSSSFLFRKGVEEQEQKFYERKGVLRRDARVGIRTKGGFRLMVVVVVEMVLLFFVLSIASQFGWYAMKRCARGAREKRVLD